MMTRLLRLLLLVGFLVAGLNGAPRTEQHHKLLLVSFDGLKWSYFDRAKDMPGFKHLAENGVRAEYMQPVFPSYTSPCHMSIATGLYPESHGVVHNCFYDQHNNRTGQADFYGTLAINEWWDNGQEPIWITASSQGLKSGGYLYPGSNATIGGKTATRSILETRDTPTDEDTWRVRIDETMNWFADDDFDFVALYFEQPDVDGHAFGPDSNRVNESTLPLIDRTMKYLFDKVEESGLTDDLNIIFASDHGMLNVNTSVRGDDAISIGKYIDPSWVTFQFSYGTLSLVEPVPDNKTAVYNALKAGSPHMDVYYKEDIPERYHYKNNERVTSIVMTAHHGYDIYRFFPGVHPNRGDHGYDNAYEDMRTSYFSIGPSFKKGYVAPGFESVNVYPLMCHLLGLVPAPNNGSLDVLFPTLSEGTDVTTTLEDTTLFDRTTSSAAMSYCGGVIFVMSLSATFLFQ